MYKTKEIEIQTRGFCDVVDITSEISAFLAENKIQNGQALVFVAGSTAGVTTVEYEPGLIKDLKEYFEKYIPSNREYHHDKKWGDGNGFSHLRSAVTGTSLAVPILGGKLALGTWQQVVLIDFDNRERIRKVIIQLSGE